MTTECKFSKAAMVLIPVADLLSWLVRWPLGLFDFRST